MPRRLWLSLLMAALLTTLFWSPASYSAELRTWRAAAGGFSTEAEFVALVDGKTVKLRLKDGTQRDVPLDKLTAADQQYARQQAAVAPDSPLAKLRHEAGRCHTAEEALRLYRVFHDDPKTTAADRQATLAEQNELRSLAERHMVRMGGQWVTEEEYNKKHREADALMKQGFEMLRLKQEDAFRKKFAEASAVEPDSIRADFWIGMLYAMFSNDYIKSRQYFDTCLKRDPENIAVLNNQALIATKRGDWITAVAMWRKAVELEPTQSIVQNLGRFIDQAGQKKLNVPRGPLENVTDMYGTLITSDKFERANLKRGWLYILVEQDTMGLLSGNKVADEDKPGESSKPASAVPPPSEDGSVVIGGGTGFVIFPRYILTNNHVVDDGTSFELQTSDGRRLNATLVAKSKKPDLALLRCDELDAPSLAIDPTICGRGTDIMTLGYPEMFSLGASLKATRGVISALPSSAVEDMYLFDAVVNHGNSGGPVFNSRGNVVAITTISVSTEVRYGGGIPGAVALEFIRKHLSEFALQPLADATLDWPAVDQRSSPSTVLVWSRSKTPDSQSMLASSNVYEERDCMICRATRIMDCPLKQCTKGIATITKNGRTARVECPVCKGKGVVQCIACKGTGIDPDLQTEKQKQAANENDAANQQASTDSPPNNGAPLPTRPTTQPPGGTGQPIANAVHEDNDLKYSHTPLDEGLAQRILTATKSNRVAETAQLGSGKAPFREASGYGGVVVGFDFGFGRFGPQATVASVRAIYLTSKGKYLGRWNGAEPRDFVHIEARPGYAVGGLKVKAGLGTDAIAVYFMRFNGDRLDPSDNYESPMYGGPGGGSPRSLGMNGALIVGIHGRTPDRPSSTFNGLGLLMLPPGA